MKLFLYSIVIYIILIPIINYVGYCSRTTKTTYGECLSASSHQDPNFKYEVNKRNLFLSTVLVPLFLTPPMVFADDYYCPIGIK